MMIDYVDTVTTIELDGSVLTVETRIIEMITVEVPGIQGAKGDKGDRCEGSINEYTQPITGLGEFVTHNLDRYLEPDQVVINESDASTQIVKCENIDSLGNVSKNECKILSNTQMNGLLTLK